MPLRFLTLSFLCLSFTGCVTQLPKEQYTLSHELAIAQRDQIKAMEARSREIEYERMKKKAEAEAIANQLSRNVRVKVKPYHHHHSSQNQKPIYIPNQQTFTSIEIRGN